MMQAARGSAAGLTGAFGSPAGGARLAGHGDGPVGDDVLLDLGRAPSDGAVALEGVEAGPLAPVDGIGAAPGGQPGRSQEVDGQLGQGLGQ